MQENDTPFEDFEDLDLELEKTTDGNAISASAVSNQAFDSTDEVDDIFSDFLKQDKAPVSVSGEELGAIYDKATENKASGSQVNGTDSATASASQTQATPAQLKNRHPDGIYTDDNVFVGFKLPQIIQSPRQLGELIHSEVKFGIHIRYNPNNGTYRYYMVHEHHRVCLVEAVFDNDDRLTSLIFMPKLAYYNGELTLYHSLLNRLLQRFKFGHLIHCDDRLFFISEFNTQALPMFLGMTTNQQGFGFVLGPNMHNQATVQRIQTPKII